MEAVVTSAYLEALTAPTSAEAVVTDAYIDVLTAPTNAQAVVTDAYLDVMTIIQHGAGPSCRAQIIG